jgi:AraC-like DNA-binding protein
METSHTERPQSAVCFDKVEYDHALAGASLRFRDHRQPGGDPQAVSSNPSIRSADFGACDQRQRRLIKYSVDGRVGGEAVTAVLAKRFPDHCIELASGQSELRAQFGLCSLNRMKLFYGRWESSLRLYLPHSPYFMQSFPIRGSCETVSSGIAMTSSPSNGCLAEPGVVTFTPCLDYEHLVTLIDPGSLLKIVTALVGTPAVGLLKLDRSCFGARRQARLLQGLVNLLVDELDAEGAIPSPVVTAELEQAILVAFLYGNKHNYSKLLDGQSKSAGPWQVRRVEEYIEANWDQPIAIEALAVVANTSARSIFHSFREHRCCSPMHFVKHVRLRHANEMLSAHAGETSVTSVAFACGFGNLGHFASDYKRAFGEMPSETLAHAKCGAHR